MISHAVCAVALFGAGSFPAPVVVTQNAVQAEAPALTDLELLRVENHALKLRLAQLETQLRTRDLTEERAAIDAALRAAYPGWGMDWQTGVLSLLPPATETTP